MYKVTWEVCSEGLEAVEGSRPTGYFIERDQFEDGIDDWLCHLRGKIWFDKESELSFIEAWHQSQH